MNNVNAQLKGINIILNSLNEDILKTKEKVKNLLNENKNIENSVNLNKEKNKNKNNENNYIITETNIKENDVNKNIKMLNSYERCLRTTK